MHFVTVLLIISIAFASRTFAQSAHKKIAEGNSLYSEEKYDEANNQYRDALIEDPTSPVINFNIGDVLYKKRNYEDALKAYDKALSSEDMSLQAKSYYNMGNTLYRIGKLPESIIMYKKALEMDPTDEDAKYNLEYVRAKLKENSDNQQSQNDQQQEQQSDQSQQQDENENDQQGDQQEQNQQQEEQNGAQQDESQESQDEQQEALEPKEISKEDAQRILDALKNEEQDLLKQQRPKRAGRPFRGKDW